MKPFGQKTIQTKDLISTLLEILNSIDYRIYGNGRASNYFEYIKGHYKDEIKLVDPVFFPSFVSQILDFSFGTSIIPKEKAGGSGERPDFLPTDLSLHPFIFETKGNDCEDLTIHYPQVQGYIQKTGAQYGILLNMKEIKVFSAISQEPIANFTFSIEKLYRDSKANPKTVDIQPNTKRFLEFIKQFSYRELDFLKKIETIAQAKPWTGKETLSLDDLTKKIREVVSILHNDVRTQKEHLINILGYDDRRKEKIAYEIDAIAESIDSKKPERAISASSLKEMLKAKPGSLDERAMDLYLWRVAYFTMTRILLVRLWEDIGFIDESLYDGGFKKWYENFNREIEKVLKYAFNLAGERYSWLFKKENNYTWHYPSDKTLVDVLYEFSHFNFSKLNADVLGTIYEEYVDRVDRKSKGQYYTPKEVVSFIWDLVGFDNDEAFFRFENGQRKPRLIFDPCTGSGGFLVEAARRIREDAKYNDGDFKDLSDIENCIINGLSGSEISPFAYYITEINLLIQLTPIIKKILDSHKHLYRHPEFALSVIHQDSLKLHNEPGQLRLGNVGESFKARDQIYEQDKKHDIVNLEGQKRQVYDFIKSCHEFDYICANPPYIGEKGHKELFRSTIKQFPYWKDFYQGKMDYLYWFIILGLSKLKEGGKLGFITTSYWPTADGAVKPRKFILDNAKIETMVDFGETKIFEGAPGQHNLVFVLEKCSEERERKENQIKVVKVKNNFDGDSVREKLRKLLSHIGKNIGKKSFSDEYVEIFVSPVRQGELAQETWNLYIKEGHKELLNRFYETSVTADRIFEISNGISTNADRVSNRNLKYLPSWKVEKHDIKIGSPIFLLRENDVCHFDKKERPLIKIYYQNVDLGSYVPERISNSYIIYTDDAVQIKDYPQILKHLEQYKEILENRAESFYPWYRLHRPRERKMFEGVKIISPHYKYSRPFVYSDTELYTSEENYILIKKENINENEKYFIAILNSIVIDLWLTNNCTKKASGYELLANKLAQIPIRRIDFNNPKEVKVHDKLVSFVESIIESKKSLAAFNQFFPQTRLTRLSENEPLPGIDIEAIVKSLPSSSLRTLRTHSEIKYEPKAVKSFYLKALKEGGAKAIILVAKDKQQITLTAPKKILEYFKEILPAHTGKEWQEIINHVLVPSNLTMLERKKKEILGEVTALHDKTAKIQEEIDEMVSSLYGISEKEREIMCK